MKLPPFRIRNKTVLPSKRLYTPRSSCLTAKYVSLYQITSFLPTIHLHSSQAIKVNRKEILHCVAHEWKIVVSTVNEYDLIRPCYSKIVPLISGDDIRCRYNGYNCLLIYSNNGSCVVCGANENFNYWTPNEVKWRERNLNFIIGINT